MISSKTNQLVSLKKYNGKVRNMCLLIEMYQKF